MGYLHVTRTGGDSNGGDNAYGGTYGGTYGGVYGGAYGGVGDMNGGTYSRDQDKVPPREPHQHPAGPGDDDIAAG